jgi:glycosyltransferase involved in cell wall biosynthesis
MNKHRILIVVPDLNLIGGKANYYGALKGRFQEDVEYFTYGPRAGKGTGKATKFWRLLSDYWAFYWKLSTSTFDLVHINPSLEPNGFLRDSVFLYIATRLCKVRTLVFWRGWSEAFETEVTGRLNGLFRMTYMHAAAMIILADEFKRKLENWGYVGPIFQETTVLTESLVEGLSEESITHRYEQPITNLLFLSRLEANKGVFLILEAFERLKKDHPGLKLDFAGTGGAMDELVKRLENMDATDIRVLGFVKGEEKKQLLQQSHVFLFPSSHDEGLPNSVLEAMGCGMPVITTLSAGLKDLFQDGKMGLSLDQMNSDSLMVALEKLLNDREMQLKMALFNYHYSKEHFLASKVVVRLENIYRKVLSGSNPTMTTFAAQ